MQKCVFLFVVGQMSHVLCVAAVVVVLYLSCSKIVYIVVL